MEGNRRYRRWFAKQPKAYRESIEETHKLYVDMRRQISIKKAMDGVDAMIVSDQDATDALRHFYDVTSEMSR